MDKEREQVSYLILASLTVAMIILILNHIPVPSFFLLLAFIVLIILGIVTSVKIVRITRKTREK